MLARYPKNGLTIGSRPDEDGFDPYCCSCCCNVNRGNGGQCLDECMCNGRNRRILARMIQLRLRTARTTPPYVGPESKDLIQTRRVWIGIAKRRGKGLPTSRSIPGQVESDPYAVASSPTAGTPSPKSEPKSSIKECALSSAPTLVPSISERALRSQRESPRSTSLSTAIKMANLVAQVEGGDAKVKENHRR